MRFLVLSLIIGAGFLGASPSFAQDEAELARHIAALESEDPRRRRAAFAFVKKAFLVAESRAPARDGLLRYARRGAEALAEVRFFFCEQIGEDLARSKAALRGLRQLGDAAAIPLAELALNAELDLALRRAACEAFDDLSEASKPAARRLERLLEDPELKVPAARALLGLGLESERALAILIAALESKSDQGLARRALAALSRRGRLPASAELREALLAHPGERRGLQQSYEILLRFPAKLASGAEVLALFERGLNSPFEKLRQRAALGMFRGGLDQPSILEEVLDFARSGEVFAAFVPGLGARAAALQSLALERLKTAKKRPNRARALALLMALARGADAAQGQRFLKAIEAFVDGEVPAERRALALLSLGVLESQRAAARRAVLGRLETAGLRVAAVQALGFMGAEGRPALGRLRALKDTPGLKKAAAEAIARIEEGRALRLR